MEALQSCVSGPTGTCVDGDAWRAIIDAEGVSLRVTSASMAPTLRPGDEVAVESLHAPPVPGDILVYFRSGSLTVHRFLGNGRLRGDARLNDDDGVSMDDVVGVVRGGIRDGEAVALGLTLPFATRVHRCLLRARRVARATARACACVLRLGRPRE